jgi:SH3-like domain-containing protein
MLNLQAHRWWFWIFLVIPGAFLWPHSALAQAVVATKKNVGEVAFINVPVAEIFAEPNAQKTATHLLANFSPIRVLTNTGQFSKIRTIQGHIGWVRALDINTQKQFVVAKDSVTTLYRYPKQSAETAFEVTRGVALEVTDAQSGWLKIRHHSGAVGYLLASSAESP